MSIVSRDPIFSVLTKFEQYYLIAIISMPLIAFFFALINQNIVVFTNSAFFTAYFILVCFTLPSLISKVFFKQNFFSLTSVLCFLYFPAMYILTLIIYHTTKIDFQSIILTSGIFTMIAWNILAVMYILREKIKKVETTVLNFAYTLIPFAIFIVVTALIRDYGSIISSDILIHKTVLNGMLDPETIGLMPATYSNTFTGQGYPILMYHTFLHMITNSFNLPFNLVGYFLDLCLTLIFSLVAFRFFLKYYNPFWSIVGTTMALLTFENLAYTSHFLIPQTLAFLFFLKILTDKKLTTKQLIIAGMVLTITHFFMGIFLTAFLFLKHFYLEKLLTKKKEEKNFLILETFLLFAFIILLSAAGFSIERYFQQENIHWFGSLSNPDFPNKLPVIFNLLGAVWILLIYGLFRILGKKERSLPELIGYFGILICLGIYFLAPIFASKFFLGFGFFASLVLISWLSNINSKFISASVATILILAYAFNFSTQFLELTRFLEQSDGTRSALVEKDFELAEYWKKEQPNCLLISDPQTQLTAHSIGEGETIRGMYMTLESRKILAEFVRKSSKENLNNVLEIEEVEEIQHENICIGISQRLIEMGERNRSWENIISTYQVDHRNTYLQTSHDMFKILDAHERIYIDNYHAIFKIENL